eukprot:870267-Amphidinium_carterae.1
MFSGSGLNTRFNTPLHPGMSGVIVWVPCGNDYSKFIELVSLDTAIVGGSGTWCLHPQLDRNRGLT